MDLPDRAKAMYKTWWSFVSHAASATGPIGQFLYTLTDAAAAASGIGKNIAGAVATWDPIGLSQLFSAAARIPGVRQANAQAPDEASTHRLHTPGSPKSR